MRLCDVRCQWALAHCRLIRGNKRAGALLWPKRPVWSKKLWPFFSFWSWPPLICRVHSQSRANTILHKVHISVEILGGFGGKMGQWTAQGKLRYLHGGSWKTLPLISLQNSHFKSKNTSKDQYFQELVLKPRTMTAAWGYWAYMCASDVYKFLGCLVLSSFSYVWALA